MARPALVILACCCGALLAGCLLRSCSRSLLVSPRSVSSMFGPVRAPQPTPAPRPEPNWQACHEQHVKEVEAADEDKGYPLLFLGDSITESWRGTDLCLPCPRCTGAPEVFERHYGKYGAGVMAIGGDQSAHLMWRLMNGEAPVKHQPKVAVVLIGTNDLGAAAWGVDIHQQEEVVMRAVPGVTLRVLQMLHLMKDKMPSTHIILMALLPRGGGGQGTRYFHWPSVFTQPLEMVNMHFRDYTRLDGHLHFLDCGDRFITPDGSAINAAIMPDALHPNAEGYELLAECMDPLIHKLMAQPAVVTEEAAAEAEATEVAAGPGNDD